MGSVGEKGCFFFLDRLLTLAEGALVNHAREHAEESTTDNACQWPDCEASVPGRQAMVRHLWATHYGIQWRCVACEALFDERETAMTCSHGQQGNKKRLKVSNGGPPASPVPRVAGPVRDPVPRRPAEVAAPAVAEAPADATDERNAFVDKCRHMLRQLGVSEDRMPLGFTLAATPALIRGLSDAQLRSLTKQFADGVVRLEQDKMRKGRGGYDHEWREFVMERSKQRNPVAPMRRMAPNAPPAPRPLPPPVQGKGAPMAPSLVMAGVVVAPAPLAAAAAPVAVTAAATVDEPDVSLEDLLIRAKRAVALLDESDTQLRYAVNLLATSRRRIADLDSTSRVLRKRLAEANHQLTVSQTQNRDLRVKMLYDDREHYRQVERLAREAKEGLGISVESAYAINQLKDLKQELLQLSPVFPERLTFEMVEVSFMQAVSAAPPQRHGTVRATRDLSGRRWLVWSDLRQGTAAALVAILNQPDALPSVMDATEKRLMERIMCFRPFALITPSSDGKQPPTERKEVLVSWDWPRFGGGLEEIRKKGAPAAVQQHQAGAIAKVI